MTDGVRTLGALERRMLVGEQLLGTYNLVGCVHLSEPIDVPAAMAALRWVFEKFEMLQYRVSLADPDGEPRLVRDVSFDDVEVFVIHQPAGLRQPFIDDAYDVESGLWRVLIRATETDPTMWLAISHVLADGHSMALVGLEWLRTYERVRVGAALPEPVPVPHAPAIEDLIPGGRCDDTPNADIQASVWEYDQVVPVTRRSTSRLVLPISHEDFLLFTDAGRARSASFQASLTSLALQSLAMIVPEIESWRIALPYDMRRRLAMAGDRDATGLLVLSDRAVVPAQRSDESRDELARDLSRRLRDGSQTIRPKRSMGADNLFGWESHCLESPTRAPASLNVTHVRVDREENIRLPAASEFFAFNSMKSGHCQFELKVWTYGPHHTCVLAYPSPLIPDDLARAFAADLVDRTKAFGAA